MTATHVLARELKRFLPWHQARLDCLSHLIVALIQVRTVNSTQLALAFNVAVQSESVYKRVKRVFFVIMCLRPMRWQCWSRVGWI